MADPLSREDAWRALATTMPSARMDGAAWFFRHGREIDIPELTRYEAAEPVPRIRSLLGEAVRRVRVSESRAATIVRHSGAQDGESLASVTLSSLGGVIRHELSAAVGWIRYTATKEIQDYESSDTNTALGSLNRRIDGLVAIVESTRTPETRRISLSEVLNESLPPQFDRRLVEIDDDDTEYDVIESDSGLLALILTNAFQNATEAGGSASIFVSYGLNERDFWITINNSFNGVSFDMNEVSASGVTSKAGHRGIGLFVMRRAADRLGYDISVRGVGGVATFSLRGRRAR